MTDEAATPNIGGGGIRADAVGKPGEASHNGGILGMLWIDSPGPSEKVA